MNDETVAESVHSGYIGFVSCLSVDESPVLWTVVLPLLTVASFFVFLIFVSDVAFSFAQNCNVILSQGCPQDVKSQDRDRDGQPSRWRRDRDVPFSQTQDRDETFSLQDRDVPKTSRDRSLAV